MEKPANGPEPLQALFEQMGRHADILRDVLEFCKTSRTVREVDDHIAGLHSRNTSVYDGVALCAMLEKAGGLACEALDQQDGQDACEPLTETVDGVEYLRPRKPAKRAWHTTQAGLDALGSYDPMGNLAALLKVEDDYLPIYLRILDMCSREGGATTTQLSQAVDDDPLVQSPRRFVQFFTEKLERAGAVAWSGSWKTTGAGVAYLDGNLR